MFPRFDAQDETVLKTFAAQAALAVRNAQLYTKTVNSLKQSDALLEVTKALSQELKIEALIQIICSKVQALLRSERCTLYILDKEKKELYTSEHMSFGMGPALPIDKEKATLIRFPMDRGIAGAVATTLQPITIPDAYKDPRFNKAMDKETGFRTRSILTVPITNHRNECVGVLQVMNKEGSAFDEEDEKLLSAFCAQACSAIENSRLFDQTERALNHALADQRNMKFMLSVTKNLFSDMHLTSMIDQMTMQVHHLLKADDCAVYLVDDVTKEFWLAKDDTHASTGQTGPNGEVLAKRFPFTTGIVGVVAQSGETIRISSGAHSDPRFSALVDQRKGKTTHSILCTPIRSELPDNQSRIVGVISVRDEKDRGGFEAEEEKLLKVFSAQAAVAIMNSKRFATIMESTEVKTSDHGAADYLKKQRGMQLASDDITSFSYSMEDIVMRGAIGTGSYGEVYKAEVAINKTPTIVAVKKLHVRNLKAEQVDAFCKEASLMCQLNHVNIVGFIGAVTEPSNLCIITEFCSRGSLADLLLDEAIWMNFKVKVKFSLEAALGMLYLHHSNPSILHRDLKSDNLLVTSDWTIKARSRHIRHSARSESCAEHDSHSLFSLPLLHFLRWPISV
jgi:GAF domain-containing protein